MFFCQDQDAVVFVIRFVRGVLEVLLVDLWFDLDLFDFIGRAYCFQVRYVDLVVEVVDVADDGVVFYSCYVCSGDDVFVFGGGHEHVGSFQNVFEANYVYIGYVRL